MERKIIFKGLCWAGATFIGAGAALSLTLGPDGIRLVGVGLGLMAGNFANRGGWDEKG